VSNFDEFISWCRKEDLFEGDLLNFVDVLEIHLNRLKEQNVIYTEIMFAPGEMPADLDLALERMKIFRDRLNILEEGRIQVEFLHCIGRMLNPTGKRVEQIVERILRFKKEGLIVGVGFAGLEKGFPVKPFRDIFSEFKKAGLGISIHAGEWCGPESVWDAIENGFADRIGHAVTAFEDSELLDNLARDKIHLEFCPTSNLKTGSIEKIEAHPINKARERKLEFSLSSDDPGAFECSVTGEYKLVQEKFGFTENELLQLTHSGLRGRFQEKQRIAGSISFPDTYRNRK
ncbi:adenosine deaminase, partial [Candidatus Riflebacteria bacterium]